MNEGKLREDITRGAKAEQLLKNELLDEAFGRLEINYLDIIKNSDLTQVELRENAYKLIRSLSTLRGHLESVVETGKLASKTLEDVE